MSEQAWLLAARLDRLSSISGTHKVDGEIRLRQVVL